MRTIHVPSTLASTTRRRSGHDLMVVLVKHGCVPPRTTSNNRIWDCGRPDTELMIRNSVVKSWKQRRCYRGMLHDDDNDDDVMCDLCTLSVLVQGQATDIQIQAEEILKLKRQINNIYVKHTKQPLAVVG